jgi:hypothetical protein
MTTSDLGIAAFIRAQGKIITIERLDAGHCVFHCEEDCVEELKTWQTGTAMVNALVYVDSYRTLTKQVKNRLKFGNS